MVGCWRDYMSGARCRVAYSPGDAVTHSLFASTKSRSVLPLWYRLTRVVPDKGPLNGCVYMPSKTQPQTSFVRALCDFGFVAVIITLHFLIEYFTFCTAGHRNEKFVKQALYTAHKTKYSLATLPLIPINFSSRTSGEKNQVKTT